MNMRRPLVVAAMVAASACTARPPLGPTQSISPGPKETFADWAELETPLTLPKAVGTATCPSTAGHTVDPATGPGLGPGPTYPVGLGTDGILTIVRSGDTWLQKVLWVTSAEYAGPVLVRGGRLDSSGPVNFALRADGDPTPELRLTSADAEAKGGAGWREWPSYTIVPGPGCYAYQVDGVGFTTVIVFSATT
jgi:hypothetical protein